MKNILYKKIPVQLNVIKTHHATIMIHKMHIAVNVTKAFLAMANFVTKTINQSLFEAP